MISGKGGMAATAMLAVSLAFSPMVERHARACDKGAAVQKKEEKSFFSSEKLPEIIKKVKGKTAKEKVESLFELLKTGNGMLKAVPSGDKRPPRKPDETIEKGGDCTELAFVVITAFKKLGIEGGAVAVHLEKDKKNRDHVVAYALINGEKIYFDPQTEKLGEIGGKHKLIMEMGFDEAESVYHREMGNYYDKKGKTDEAVKEFEKAVKINPKDAYCHHMLGVLYGQKGEVEKSKKHYDIAAELDAENKKYQENKKTGTYNEELKAAYEAYQNKDYKSEKEHFENALNSGEKLSKKEKKMLEENIAACEQMISQ